MIAVIGGGPAGTFAAYSLARAGFDVQLFEEHKIVGNPIQCSGVITPAIEQVLPNIPRDIIVNKIDKVRFYAPDNSFFDVKIPTDYVFDRAKLDQYLARCAEKAGVKISLQKRFEHFERKADGLHLKFEDGTSTVAQTIIGADGPYSKVAKCAGLMKEREYIHGLQARAYVPVEEKNRVDIFLGYGSFGWSIPEDDRIARVGIICGQNKKADFDRLLQRTQAKVIGYQSGMIPLYNPNIQASAKDVYLIGDAAGQIKASTHGGILYSMLAGQELTNALRGKGSYESLWRKKLGLNLWLNLKIHKTLDKFSEKDLNTLVHLFSQDKLKNILSQNVRDFPSKFLMQMLMKEPRLLQFGLKAF